MKALGTLRNTTLHNRNETEFKKSFHRYTNDMGREKDNNSTPEVKLSTQFSSSRAGRGNSEQISSKLKHRGYNQTENEGNETFITSTDYHQQMSAMDERISKLENLVWNLYKELNVKIDNTTASTQARLEENKSLTQQIFNQLGDEIGALREDFARATSPIDQSQDEGYDGSEENDREEMGEAEGEQHYIQGSLDEVVEEMSSQYYSGEDKHEFSRHSLDKTDPLLESSRDKPPYNYRNKKYEQDGESEQYLLEPDFINPDLYKRQDFGAIRGNSSSDNRRETSTPLEGSDGEGDLEYYFSCHERMIKDYTARSMSQSDIFKNINKEDLKDNFSMPDLSRTTLVDQIDYELDNFKVNESSVFETSSEEGYGSTKNVNCSTLRDNKMI